MNTLHVTEAKTETTPGEFVTDGYRITVDESVAGDYAGKAIYQSRFANKAVMKAVVLTADERFASFTVQVDPEVAAEAGKKNLELMLQADRFTMIKQACLAEPDTATAVEAIKVMDGNNIPPAEALTDGASALAPATGPSGVTFVVFDTTAEDTDTADEDED